MGKNARERKEKLEQQRKEQKELIKRNYREKNPWIFFWRRVDFWIIVLCVSAIFAYPFVPKISFLGAGLESEKPARAEAIISTSMGDIGIAFYTKDAPKTVDNFKKLVKDGFYKGLTWHRVIKGFMIQTGDPLGDGTGGPGYQFDDEINDHKIVPGTVAMANSGVNTNGSQFFIVTDEAQPQLDGKHTVFGYVTSGMDVAKLISEAPTDEKDKPMATISLIDVKLQ